MNMYTTCSSYVSAMTHGQTLTVVDNDVDHQGYQTLTCNNGVLEYGGESCGHTDCTGGCTGADACPDAYVEWNAGSNASSSGGTCYAHIVGGNYGGSKSVTNAATGHTGSATFMCGANNTWSYTGVGSCN